MLYNAYKTESNVVLSDEKHRHYIRAKNIYRQEVDRAKKDYNARVIDKSHNPVKAAWSIISNSYRAKPVVQCKKSPDEVNNAFMDAVDEIVEGLPESMADPALSVPLSHHKFTCFKPISEEDLMSIVQGFKTSHSQDVYGLSVFLLKKLIWVLMEPLLSLVNSCLIEGVFPNCLKIAKTVPIFKKGDPTDVGSFRPISIVPVLGKIIETSMLRQLTVYLERSNLMGDMQHGFRKGRSTTSAVLSLVERIHLAFEERKSVDLVLCDLTKAFDCVSHNILLDKLHRYGIRDSAWSMVADYLSDRRQVVSVMGATSEERRVAHGVPQGSVLGPLLFLILINDLHLQNSSLLFADDTTIVGKGSGPLEARCCAQELFSEAKEWFAANKLKLNEAKTQEMLCTLSTHTPGDEAVILLGFRIDAKLSWEPHIDQVCRRLSRVIFLFRKLRSLLSLERLVMMYHAVFCSHVQYGILLWGHSPHANDILLLQKKALRILTYSDFIAHCQPIFRRLKVHTVFGLYILASLTAVKINRANMMSRCQVHSYGTRGRLQLEIPRCRLSRVKDSFPVLALKMFNLLPGSVRDLPIGVFKKRLSSWLIERSYYSVNDFLGDSFEGL